MTCNHLAAMEWKDPHRKRIAQLEAENAAWAEKWVQERKENDKLREALDTLRNECTSELGSPEDYIKALKKADAALVEGE